MRNNTLIDDFKYQVLYSKNTLAHLIFINIAIYILIGLPTVFLSLFRIDFGFYAFILRWFSIPADPVQLLLRPWVLFSYQFIHSLSIFHILFNMLILYWFGRIFQEYLGNQKLLSTYLIGGIAGAIMFMLAFNFFPLFREDSGQAIMVGASASVLAIVVGIATLLPNYSLHLILLGPVRLKYIALALVIIDVLFLASANAGGRFAHLGGALYGFIYVSQLQKGNDYGKWMTVLLHKLESLFKPKPNLKVKHKSGSPHSKTHTGKTKPEQDEIDRILDKISKSGYNSLTSQERDVLFNASKE